MGMANKFNEIWKEKLSRMNIGLNEVKSRNKRNELIEATPFELLLQLGELIDLVEAMGGRIEELEGEVARLRADVGIIGNDISVISGETGDLKVRVSNVEQVEGEILAREVNCRTDGDGNIEIRYNEV